MDGSAAAASAPTAFASALSGVATGIGSAAELKSLIGTTAKLTFHPVVRVTQDAGAQVGPPNPGMGARADQPGAAHRTRETADLSALQNRKDDP